MFENSRFMAGVGALLAGLAGPVFADCLPAKGKITNNAQPDGSTLGVAALNLGGQKFKCGIIGLPQFLPTPGLPTFKHTVVCDDHALPEDAQAQITFDTRFLGPPTDVTPCPENAPGEFAFSFQEISVADPTTGRGLFRGVEGEIIITGDFECGGGIRMTFEGEMCLPDD